MGILFNSTNHFNACVIFYSSDIFILCLLFSGWFVIFYFKETFELNIVHALTLSNVETSDGNHLELNKFDPYHMCQNTILVGLERWLSG